MLLENGEHIIGSELLVAGIGTIGAGKIMEVVLKKAQLTLSEIDFVMATGYGRRNFEPANSELSELSCHAKGVLFKNPLVRTIIDIGGQDAKVLRINDKGILENFMMNDKCAAGTGRFLDVMANILQIPINELEKSAELAEKPAKISSTCTVFAESEVISQLASGETVGNVIAGICNSVASRVAGLAKRVGIEEEVFMSGGVAQNGGVRKALEKELKVPIQWSETSQMMGALGAAISAYEQVKKERCI